MVNPLRCAITCFKQQEHVRRYAISALVLMVFCPLLPGLFWALMPVFDGMHWQLWWREPQWIPAMKVTLISAVVGTLGAFVLAMLISMVLFPGRRWQQLQQRLPLFLSLPHVAFTVGFVFLIAPSGYFARLMAHVFDWITPPDWHTIHDANGWALAVVLALRESVFFLWMLFAILADSTLSRQMMIGKTLGYSSVQCWLRILIPQIIPRLGWPFVAVLAYGLSVVDVALIIGPTTPPSLAVLTWQWLTDPAPEKQAMGNISSLMLVILLLIIGGVGRLLWWVFSRIWPYPTGIRSEPRQITNSILQRLPAFVFLIFYLVLFMLGLWSFATSWFFPALWPDHLTVMHWRQTDFTPFWTTLWLGLAACFISLPLVLCWLEWGARRWNGLLYLPLILPALPLMSAQYQVLLHWRLDGTILGLVWSHLIWVFPYMLLTLVGPYQAFDQRYLLIARMLRHSVWVGCLRVKWPMLLIPILNSLAVGFSVSLAQYLPTLFAGGGRYDTVTTEAVALSAGGNSQVLAIQAFLQFILPFLAFSLAAFLPKAIQRYRRGRP